MWQTHRSTHRYADEGNIMQTNYRMTAVVSAPRMCAVYPLQRG
jgi:hypothetical protein